MKKTDQEILTILKENPSKAIEYLIANYMGLVWEIAGQYLKNPEDIKECVNDVFWNFYVNKHNYLPEKGSLSSYLAGITKKKAISSYQKNKSYEKTMCFTEGTVGISDDWEDALINKIILDGAMNILGQKDFQMIQMRFLYGMTNREIANFLLIPYETVKKRNQRSLKKLRHAI